MKLLAIDASTDNASIAYASEGLIKSVTQNNQRAQAQFLLPMIDSLLKECGGQVGQLDAILFGCGPGSFTGLRIACSLAKGLAYAHNLKLIPVSTLGSIAWQAQKKYPETAILSIIDARMQEVYWSFHKSKINEESPNELVSNASLIDIADVQQFVLAGVGVREYGSCLSAKLQNRLLDTMEIYPTAASMIELAQFLKIKAINNADAQPIYIRNQVTS